MSELLTQPYKGLMPYDEADASYFFGREAEREIISANLMASRLTLLYGASGVGKTSVLRAGVAPHLRQMARQNLIERGTTEFAVVVFNSWRDDPVAGLMAQVEQAVHQALNQPVTPIPSNPTGSSLIQVLQRYSDQIDGDLLIILDQFEEYFLYHPQEEAEGTFAFEFPKAVNRPELRVSFLVSIREDAMAKLDRFKGKIPNLFENYLRIDHLDRAAARQAIEEPIVRYNKLQTDTPTIRIEPELVEAVLDQVKTGKVTLGETGRGLVDSKALPTQGERIETPYLQLVMTRLWDEEISSAGSNVLRLSTLKRLGGAEHIVRTHLDTTLSALPAEERDASARIFHYLVTPSGTKIAHAISDLAEYAQISPERLTPILEKLSGTGIRILRPVAPPLNQPGPPHYEIFHDVLAPAILDWRARYTTAQELAEAERRRIESEKKLVEERRRVSKLRWGFVGLSILLLLMIGLAGFVLHQRAVANRAQADALAQRDKAERAQAEALAQRDLAKQSQIDAVTQRDKAERAQGETEAQRKIAVARELSAASLNNLEVDPERSILLALQAVSLSSATGKSVLREAEGALHRAVQASRVKFTLRGHSSSLNGVAFSPDGTRLATSSSDKTVKVWDLSNGKELLTLSGHTAAVNGIAYSPDGKRLASASLDRTARLWDTATGKELRSFVGHTDAIKDVAFSPDGMRLATGSSDKTAKLWDLSTGKGVFTFSGHSDVVNRVAFSPDGTRLATASNDNTIKVWDLITGKTMLSLSGDTSQAWGLAFSPDGKYVAAAYWNGVTAIFDTMSGQLAQTIFYPSSNNAVAFDRSGRLLALGSGDGMVKVWDVVSYRGFSLYGHAGSVGDVAFSPDGTMVATASLDGTAKIWDVGPTGGQEWLALAGHKDGAWDVAYSSDGKLLATAGFDKITKVWDSITGRELATLSGHAGAMLSVCFHPDSKRLATFSEDGTTRVWDIPTGRTVYTLSTQVARGMTNHSMAFSADGKRLATISDGKNARVWEAATGRALLTLSGDTERLFCLSFSPDGLRLATGGEDKTARIWDIATGKVLRTFNHTGRVYGVAFSPDGKYLLTGSADGTGKIWDVSTGKAVLTLSGHRGIVFSVAFSADGRRVATSSSDSTIKVWDFLPTNNQVQEPLTLFGKGGPIYRVIFSPDGKRLATASRWGVHVYALPTEDIVAIAKSRVTRSLTQEECQKFLHMDQCLPAP